MAMAVSPFAAERDVAIADAAERGDASAVRALLKQGADVNTAQGDGMTALHWAAMNGDANLASLLLGAGANTRAATRINRYTPLMLAARQGHGRVVEALLAGGADPSITTDNGTTVLMFAAASGDVACVEAIAKRKVDLNARETVRGLTASMFAAAANHAAIVTSLGRAGAEKPDRWRAAVGGTAATSAGGTTASTRPRPVPPACRASIATSRATSWSTPTAA
jgi:ankyrin repeat protein